MSVRHYLTPLLFFQIMSQVVLAKFTIKPGCKDTWLEWTDTLKSRADEVMETLKNEGVFSESCFISKEGEIFYFMEVDDFDRVKEAVSKSTHKIDLEHKEVRLKTLDLVEKMECLFHFENRGV